jgi:sulfatase-like protein
VRRAFLVLAAGVSLTGALSCGGHAPATSPTPRALPAETHPPVVMVVLDEFSTTSLLDRHRRIDPLRYPNFARLARDGTWFPNATSSSDDTGPAMRAFITSRVTYRSARQSFPWRSHNIFTLMARRYRLDVSEEVSSLCPKRLCPNARQLTRRQVLHRLATGRAERFDRWVRSIHRSRRPTFYYKHVLLPHGPWRYLPDGRLFPDGATQSQYSWNLIHFTRWLVDQNYQRHLLQLGFTDRLMGRLIARLEATGIYDRALIVVTADNGEGFGRLGNGHEISRKNAGDIALTPLIVKLPRQRGGRIVRRHVRTSLDVLPTIARVVHLRIPWRVQGRSVFGPAARGIPSTTVLYKRDGQRFTMSLRNLQRRASSALRLKLRLFGSGNEPPGLYGLGPFAALHGRLVAGLKSLPAGRTRAAIDGVGRYSRVRHSSTSVPVRVMGRLTASGSTKGLDVAVAVNGRIVATGPTFAPRRGAAQLFSILIPVTSLRDGRNDVRLYAIGGGGTRLRPLTP